MRGHRDLELVAGASLVCAPLAVILPFELLRVLFAVPLTLFFPGYAIATATFSRRPQPGAVVLLLSLALSLATLALGALLLNYVPGGINEIAWALLLLLVILNGCRIAALRRPRAPRGTPSWPRLRLSPAEGALLGGGLVVATVALIVALTPQPARNALGYSELWISPSRPSPDTAVARIGVRSEEKRRISYFLRVRFGDGKPDVRLLELDPGESVAVRVETSQVPSGPSKVTAAIFRQSQPSNVYRRVVANLPAAAPR